MSNEEIINSLFLLMHKLRTTKRKGWHDKNIQRARVESVADHIYGCQMLAYAMQSEFEYDIDINKVVLMLAVHEIGETIIGDITPEDMPGNLKSDYERNSVSQLLDLIPNSDLLRDLFDEFEAKQTKEAKFAYQIDKAECDLQAKLYEQDGAFSHKYPKYSFSNNWISFDLGRIHFDENFTSLLRFVIENEMHVQENTDDKVQNVISFYTATNTLKDVQRTGEKIWRINQEHYGSIAEHIYSVQMLAIAINIVYSLNINITRVINMLSIHELGEIKVGDISTLLKNEDDRNKEWDAAVSVAALLSNNKNILLTLSEFNEEITPESIYSKYCDKLAPDIISKIYDQQGLIDLKNQEGNPLLKHPIVKKYLDMGKSFSEMWMLYGQEVYKYPEPFISVSNYVLNNELTCKFQQTIEPKGRIKIK